MARACPTPETLNAYRQAIEDNLPNMLKLLARLCALPSVSAQRRALPETAAVVREILEAEGFRVEEFPGLAGPMLVAERAGGPRSVLLYNHYDVQPPEPLELWDSPPFELTRRGDSLFARGVSDDKGHLVSRIASLRAVRKVRGGVPLTVKFLVEGEEEIGSPSVPGFVEQHAARLRSDACLWEFGGVDVAGRPWIYCGMKGVVCVDLRLRTVDRDMHSMYGAVIPNAATRLAQALASMVDYEGHIRIEGWYSRVRPPDAADEAALSRLPDYSRATREDHAVRRLLGGLEGVPYLRRLMFEPVLNVNGIESGYAGEGSKTVLPAEARAKLDLRLVPDQDPDEMVPLMRAHLDRHGFEDVEITQAPGYGWPARTPMDDPFVRHVTELAEPAWGVEPAVWPIVPGSGPMHAFTHTLKTPVGAVGIGWEGSRAHSPNENVRLNDFRRGTLHGALVLEGWEA